MRAKRVNTGGSLGSPPGGRRTDWDSALRLREIGLSIQRNERR